MGTMIENISSSDLFTAMENNMAAFWSVYGRTPGSTLHAAADVVWFYTGLQVAILNGVVSVHQQPEGIRETMEDLQALINAKGAPAYWWTGPESQPVNIGSLLEDYGLQPSGETPGMALELGALDENPGMVPGFTIRRVNTPQMRSDWSRVAAIGTGFPGAIADAFAGLEITLNGPQYEAQPRYLGYLDGIPVATSALVLEAGVAGIYAVATLPEARRKGIGRMMTVVPLLEAKQAGYQVGILQASSMGYPIYKQLGFVEVCRYKIYIQGKKEA